MKTIIFDMYGVIIKESKGNFIPYTYNHFPKEEHSRITALFKDKHLFTKAGLGEIDSDKFLACLGFTDTSYHMQDYIKNHLTLDEGFYTFAEKYKDKYHFALLSNDVSQWSKYITEFYNLNQYLSKKIVSADVHCRKPSKEIYEIALDALAIPANECIFIDNSVKNLLIAEELGMDTVLFNRDGENYDRKVVYSFEELDLLFETIL